MFKLPFNLELALKGGEGVIALTESGQEVHGLTSFEGLPGSEEALYTLVGLVDGSIETWTGQGKYHACYHEDPDRDDYDLAYVQMESLTVWVNIYVDSEISFEVFLTEQEADDRQDFHVGYREGIRSRLGNRAHKTTIKP